MAGPEHAAEVLRAPAAGGPAERDRVRVLRLAAGDVPAGHRPLRSPLEHGVQSREPRAGGPRRPGGRVRLYHRGHGSDHQGSGAPALHPDRYLLHDRTCRRRRLHRCAKPWSIAGICFNWETSGSPASFRPWVPSSTPAAGGSRSPSGSATACSPERWRNTGSSWCSPHGSTFSTMRRNG